MSGGNAGGTMSDINVTPLVDVMLVLLIIFMITAPMLNNAGVEIDLPKSDAPPLPMEQDDQLMLSMTADRKVYFNDQDTAFELDELLPRLRAIAQANPDQPVFLRADGDLPYREVVGLLDLAKQAGMPRVGLVFDPTGEPVQGAP
ncbi:MAG: ExbD/TolR family protein [Myxococcales bacterium]|nr:ExbD/TolR family protein [Myxococcales bacterium]